MRNGILHATILALLVAADTAAAQTTVPTPAPPGSLEAPPERIEPQPPIGAPTPEKSLSEALKDTGGVIKPPPGMDPGIVEPTPDPRRFPTPVVPPGTVTPQTAPK